MKLFLTIGVSEASPLSYLPGAITVAREDGGLGTKVRICHGGDY